MGTDTPVLDVPPHVLNYLNEQTTLTLATASPTGMPRAATLTYAYAADWRQTKGIQGSGEGRQLLNPDEIRHAVELFQEKFEALTGGLPSNISLFRITPTELQFIDSAGAGGQEAEQALGFDFRSDLVFAVFHSLPQEEVTTIASKLQTMEVDSGTVIVRQGAPADKFFIIVDGEVEVVRDDEGVTRTVASLKRGQFFGEMAILRDMPRTATVQAVAPTTLFALDRDAFRSLVAQSLGTTEDFDQVIQKRLNELSAGPGA